MIRAVSNLPQPHLDILLKKLQIAKITVSTTNFISQPCKVNTIFIQISFVRIFVVLLLSFLLQVFVVVVVVVIIVVVVVRNIL